jgi:hypothetical protein
VPFAAPDDYWSCRDSLISSHCEFDGCLTRERALAQVLRSLIPRERLKSLAIHEAAPRRAGLSKWLEANVPNYIITGYFPDAPFGEMTQGIRNEDLEAQTFGDETFDVVLHLDVLEHLFNPFVALKEIFRTLRVGGYCIFSVPTYRELVDSAQAAVMEEGGVRYIGEPEYHGNPQRPEDMALVTWKYGHDLPLLIQRHTGFDVEVRRFQSKETAVMGYMNDIYVLHKPGNSQQVSP